MEPEPEGCCRGDWTGAEVERMRVVVVLAEPWTSTATRLRESETSEVLQRRDGGCTVLARVEERAPDEAKHGDLA